MSPLEALRCRFSEMAPIDVSRLALLLIGVRCHRCGQVSRRHYSQHVHWLGHVRNDELQHIRELQACGLTAPWKLHERVNRPIEARARETIRRHAHLLKWI